MKTIWSGSFKGDEVTYSYNVQPSSKGDIIDFVISVYSDNNDWGKEKVLTSAITYRRKFDDVLEYLGVSKEGFHDFLMADFEEDLAFEDALDSTVGDLIHIELVDRNKQGGFAGYDDSENFLTVLINQEDYSCMFDSFDVYEDNAVNKAFEILVSGKHIKPDNDFTNLARDLTEVFESEKEQDC